MSQLVWSYKRLPDLDNRVGFIEVEDAKAKTLLASGDVQDPKIGAKALKYIDDAYAAIPAVKPAGFVKPSSSAITATGFKVTWIAPTGGTRVDNYEVSIKKGTAAISGSPFTMASGTLSKTVSGLVAASDYVVVVKAINKAGEFAAPELTVHTIAAS